MSESVQNVDCICLTAQPRFGEVSLDTLAVVRDQCAALREVLIPSWSWPGFEEWHRRADLEAFHRSIVWLAFERGYLARVTGSIHRYLLRGNVLRTDVRRQYTQDLCERWWMSRAAPTERHRTFKSFFGRVIELQVAEWLETAGWRVTGLEAVRPGPDIEAQIQGQPPVAFEVKFIWLEDADFQILLQSLSGQPAAASVSPYAAANYLIFRTYEAAKQLQKTTARRVALLVIDQQTWFRFAAPLERGWIDWKRPRFSDADSVWARFLDSQRARYSEIDSDLERTLGVLDGLWIARLLPGYEYSRPVDVPMRAV